MKKLAFALMLVLPFIFTACGDDDDDNNVEPVVTFTMPVQNWGANQAAVKAAVPTSFSLNTNISDAETLVYQTLNPTDGNRYNLPWQFYDFENDALTSASYLVDYVYETKFEEWLGKNYNDYGYDAEDECVYYGNTKNQADCTLLVVYQPYEEDGVEALMAVWVPLDSRSRANIHEVVKAKVEKARSTAKKLF